MLIFFPDNLCGYSLDSSLTAVQILFWDQEIYTGMEWYVGSTSLHFSPPLWLFVNSLNNTINFKSKLVIDKLDKSEIMVNIRVQ